MFKIQLSPVAGIRNSEISLDGDVLTINGVSVDFAVLGEGEQCETSEPLLGMARRVGGVVSVSVRYEYDTATAEPMQSTDFQDYIVSVISGPVPDVIRRKPKPEVMEIIDAQTSN